MSSNLNLHNFHKAKDGFIRCKECKVDLDAALDAGHRDKCSLAPLGPSPPANLLESMAQIDQAIARLAGQTANLGDLSIAAEAAAKDGHRTPRWLTNWMLVQITAIEIDGEGLHAKALALNPTLDPTRGT